MKKQTGKSSIGRVYGWNPDLPSLVEWYDHYALSMRTGSNPDFTAWYKFVKWCNDQLKEGSCTANAGVSVERLYRAIKGMPDFNGARQFLYAATRIMRGGNFAIYSDSGASIADTVLTEQKFGVCLEQFWPYSKGCATIPSTAAYKEALNHQVLTKAPVRQTQDAIEAVLAAGLPLQFGFTVYPSFESKAVQKSGSVPMPTKSDLRAGPLGGHAQCGCDYDRRTKQLCTLNSWGNKNGLFGIGLMKFPYSYILDPDLASDFWTISAME